MGDETVIEVERVPLATEDRNRCTYKRENGHRCARVAIHWPLDAHYFREDAAAYNATRPDTGGLNDG